MHMMLAAGMALVTSATATAGTYTNPIIPGDKPDPGAIYVEGTFYVATTSDSIQPDYLANDAERTLFPISHSWRRKER